MIWFSILFLAGDIVLQQLYSLPPLKWVMLFVIISLSISLIFRKYINRFKLVLFFASGFLWAYGYATYQLSWAVPNNLEGKTITIKGYIATIPDNAEHQTSFLFSIRNFNNQTIHRLVKLSWRNAPNNLKTGDFWQLDVRLKHIHGLSNPGSFDYEAWAFEEGIRANGYVVASSNNKLIAHHRFHYSLNQTRQFLKEKIEKNLPKSNTSPWIIALAVGERSNIAQENWEVLRNTGTNHLMAIAGLHIGFMSGFVLALVTFLWKLSARLCLRIPASQAGAIAALAIAIIYSALAGFSIPTQRACIMLAMFLIILLFRRKAISWYAWSYALLIVLLVNPLSILTESLWLSFGSVALIIYGVSGRLRPKGIWWKLGRIQWVIAFGLLPLSIWLFQQFSLIAFIANCVAIPWVGFVIVPSTLLGSFFILFSEKLGSLFLWFADKNLGLLWEILSYLSHLSWANWYQYVPDQWVIIAACIGIIILLLPQGMPGRWFGLIWLLPLVLYKPVSPDLRLTLLDVGQGLSSVVQTKHHILIFDTGARLSDEYDMGSSVIVPFLRTLGIKNIDMLVVSHGDNDHIGGANSILKSFSVNTIKTSVPAKFPTRKVDYCLRNQKWRWDGIDFEFIYPPPENLNRNNDSSCVLRISNGHQSILLTGDIEKFAEKYLVENNSLLKSDILIAPHHGSKTSAEDDFLKAVHPQYALFPVGYRNRYHFPNKDVIRKYSELKVKQFNSVRDGAIQLTLSDNESMVPVVYRQSQRKYWREIHLN